jgi:hypothetical protein
MTHASRLSDLIDLTAALKSDSSMDLDVRKLRDREIGQALLQHRNSPAQQLRGWLDRVRIQGWTREGQAGAQLYRVLCVLLAIAGLAAGWGLARAALYYTGDRPINVLNVLGVLVVPQMLLLLVWLLAALPRAVPLFSSLQSAARFLSPGRLARRLAGWFPAHSRQGLEVIWDPGKVIVMAPAARWLFSFWSQLFAVWFNLGVLAALFYLISFSDLAFAWSTTLSLDNAVFHRALLALSWPWHGLFPDAVPGAELVAVSRYYRLEEGSLTAAPALAAQLGGWWPFLVAAIVCYGLLPRLLTLLFSWQRFRHHLGKALSRMPGAPELLARMNSPLVSTAARQPETTAQGFPAADRSSPAPTIPTIPTLPCTVVDWSGSVGGMDERQALEPRLRAMGIEPLAFVAAGGACTTQQDEATVGALCGATGAGVAVITKSWEPPLLEFVDFIRDVRARCGRGRAIIVLLRGGGDGVAERDREIWRATLRQLKDANLHVEAIGPSS